MNLFDIFKKQSPTPFVQISETELLSRGFSKEDARNMVKAASLDNLISTQHGQQPLFKIQEAKLSLNPFDQYKRGLGQQTLKEYVAGAFNVSNSMVALWSQAVTQRRDYIMVSAELRKFYIVKQLLDLIAADVLNADDEGKIVEFKSDDQDIKFELDLLSDSLDFNILLTDFVTDFIDIGEYALHIVSERGKGILRIDDDLDQMNIIALYDGGWPASYLHYAPLKDNPQKLDYMIESSDYAAHFIMGTSKLRVALVDQLEKGYTITSKSDLPTELQDKLPDYIRVGTPLFWGIISKLRELQLLEMLIPATKLNQITQSTVVAVGVSATDPPDKVFGILRRYEDLLNIPIGIDTTREQLSMAEIMTAAGKIRAIPKFDDGKGTVDVLNVRKNEPVDDILDSITDIRKIICSSIGVPYSLLYGSDDKEKSNELRLFSRYTRKLAEIQKSIRRGLIQIAAIHLKLKGYNVSPKDIDVRFIQPLTDLSSLEYMELIDAKQEMAGRRLDFIAKIKADPDNVPYLNLDNIRHWEELAFEDVTEGIKLFNDKPDPTKQQFVGDVPMANPTLGMGDNSQIAPGDPLKTPPQKNNDPYNATDDPDRGADKRNFGLENRQSGYVNKWLR